MSTKGLNRVTLIGRMGKDPEFRATTTGMSICKVSLATTERAKDKSGEWVDDTEWHNLVFFGTLADTVYKYLKKGSQVWVEGRIKTNTYEDQSGQKKYFTEILCNNLIMLDSKEKSDSGYSPRAESNYNEPPSAPESHLPGDDPIDDIPF